MVRNLSCEKGNSVFPKQNEAEVTVGDLSSLMLCKFQKRANHN